MGKEKHELGEDGVYNDGVAVYPADAHDMASFELGKQALAGMPVPRLHNADNEHERLYVAAFDGTRNDADNDPQHKTNVGEIRDQIRQLNTTEGYDGSIKVGYVKGVGTQDNWLVRTIDGAIGYTYDERIELMYERFIRQAAKWLQEDPDAKIRIADIGFSRGAEQAAGFARLVHERGIQDWTGIRRSVDEHGRTVVEYTKPPLVPPGKIAQAVGLFDPVGTGEPRNHDRRLPESVISGFQITSEDERRGLFKSTSLIDLGMTVDGRFLAVMLAGAHSDIGGGYHRNGLSLRAGNLMMDYLNSLSDTPFLHKLPEPTAPGMNVVHRSEEGMLLYRMWKKIDRQSPDGAVETLAPGRVCRVVEDCRNAEPRDEALTAGFEFTRARIGPAPAETHFVDPPLAIDATSPTHPDYQLLLQAMSAVDRMETGLHRTRDRNSDRLATGLVVAAKQSGLDRIDHVVLNDKGEYAFAVQGDMGSPFRRVARVDTSAAIDTSVGRSLRRIEAVNDAQERQLRAPEQAQHEQARVPAMMR